MPPAVALGYVVLYLLLDWVSYIHPMRGTNITAWNPQAALAVALVAWNPRCWWLVAGSLSAGALARSLPALNSADLVASLTQTVGYVSIGAAFRRWLNPVPSLATRKEYLVFLLIIGTGAALNATLYAGTLTLFNQASPQYLLQAISRGLIGEIVSQVVTLPVLFALVDRVRRAETFAMVATVEWWVVAAAAMIGAYVVFGRATEDQFKFFYLLLLPVAWGAARFGYVGAAWSALLVQLLLILAVQSAAYLPLTVFELHMLMAVLGAAGLLLGTTVDERERAEQALRASLHIAAAGDMAAALAHELNQPLTALRAYARASQLLAQRLAPPTPKAARRLRMSPRGSLRRRTARATS
ncbi:MAG TPA: MASE1 domain-containing protein [Burkholderiaceae bacterium]|nr:MASE1 domain-containing protein [Burkholderiaceae bacterium]